MSLLLRSRGSPRGNFPELDRPAENAPVNHRHPLAQGLVFAALPNEPEFFSGTHPSIGSGAFDHFRDGYDTHGHGWVDNGTQDPGFVTYDVGYTFLDSTSSGTSGHMTIAVVCSGTVFGANIDTHNLGTRHRFAIDNATLRATTDNIVNSITTSAFSARPRLGAMMQGGTTRYAYANREEASTGFGSFVGEAFTKWIIGRDESNNNVGQSNYGLWGWDRRLPFAELLELDDNPYAFYQQKRRAYFIPAAAPPAGGRVMSSLAHHGGLAGVGGIAGEGGGLAG